MQKRTLISIPKYLRNQLVSAYIPILSLFKKSWENYLIMPLESKGYDKIHAVNGAEAVDFCRQNPDISIVLMDIKMPVMNGAEATKKIREYRPELPIIAVTAYAQTGDEHRFTEAGVNDYIAKPVNKGALLEKIQKYFY